MEAIYDDVQVSTHASNRDHSPCYQGLVKTNIPFEYASLGEISKKSDVDDNRSAYKSLVVADQDDNAKSEYANQSGAFLLKSCVTDIDKSHESDQKSPKRYVYVNQRKKVSINEPSDSAEKEDKELKSQKEIPKSKRNFKIGFLYFLILCSTLISVTALAVATVSIVRCTQEVAQYRSEVNCLMELLLQNESFYAKYQESDCGKNGTQSMCPANKNDTANCTMSRCSN